MADSDPDVRWMSYAEAARTLKVTPESLHRRMRRNSWARREGNDGKPRVAVPIDVLRRFDPVPDDVGGLTDGVPDPVPDAAADSVPDNPDGEAAALREALGRERDRADKAEQRAERAEAAAAVVPELRERLGRAEGESATLRERMESERDRANKAEAELEGARLGRAAAEAGMEGLRAALAEAKRPFWRRWIGP